MRASSRAMPSRSNPEELHSVPAYIYPGQGSQTVGMGHTLASVSDVAAQAWQEADAALGEPISRLAWEGPADQLDLTVNAQPALLAASIAAHRALEACLGTTRSAIGMPSFLAGHSMGQYSAMVAAGVLDFGDGLRLVRERGRLMQASSGDGAMAAIIGLPEAEEAALLAAGADLGELTIANRNSPGQIVISGSRPAVEAAADAARGLGARRSRVLPVSVAAHSPLMAQAAEGMRLALAEVEFRTPSAPLLANADAIALSDGEACRDELIDHLTRGVDWVTAVRTMVAAGVDTFLEVGPGKVLTGLVRRIAPDVTTIAIDDITTSEGLELPAQSARSGPPARSA
jgi:[acyl-carrier-protein] S-malonyltransferase